MCVYLCICVFTTFPVPSPLYLQSWAHVVKWSHFFSGPHNFKGPVWGWRRGFKIEDIVGFMWGWGWGLSLGLARMVSVQVRKFRHTSYIYENPHKEIENAKEIQWCVWVCVRDSVVLKRSSVDFSDGWKRHKSVYLMLTSLKNVPHVAVYFTSKLRFDCVASSVLFVCFVWMNKYFIIFNNKGKCPGHFYF